MKGPFQTSMGKKAHSVTIHSTLHCTQLVRKVTSILVNGHGALRYNKRQHATMIRSKTYIQSGSQLTYSDASKSKPMCYQTRSVKHHALAY
ncbi:hypothetical protein BaRGS_00040512 [Batillaria attramentaria]|uniref:Uncharacterized protein n=1 Tax=Batillaria attramentaria TaxID=370345 RepID=A0ABD0J0R0_9CAEN